MYERFTDRARKMMQLANQEALRFNHEYIGTEHIAQIRDKITEFKDKFGTEQPDKLDKVLLNQERIIDLLNELLTK